MTDKNLMYVTGENAFKDYSNQSSEDVESVISYPKGYAKTVANRTFVGHDTNISVRSDYNVADYEYFRPSNTVPYDQKDIIAFCMEAYQKVGLVRNVIDLMGDFGAQGIRLQHANPTLQQFYNTWFEKVNGPERSERFLNQLYRCGQVIIKKSYGRVSNYEEKKWKKGKAKPEVKVDKIKVNSREIPLKYRFINPINVEILSEDLAQFTEQPLLGLRLSAKFRNTINKYVQNSTKIESYNKKILEKIPEDILSAIKKGVQILPLDPDKIDVYYYKKDDWMMWANPMCYCILDDLIMLNMLKLADKSALDGAISNIRLWTLGIIGDSPANSILPTKTAINKVRNILANNVGGGVLDFVWGPELKFTESNSQVWRFLGSEKYQVTVNNIYEGLGIPAPLRTGSSATNTGNFIGLNTLIKRLKYGRDLLVHFWSKELKYIHKAMGFTGEPPKIIFDFMVLADESAEKQLLINLWDRDILSDETILELFGRIPNIEKSRVQREATDRTHERMPYKASPYHNPDKEHEYRKILLQGGGVAPSEIGIDLNDRKDGEKTRLEQMSELSNERQNTGQPGRPDNIIETKKRKPKPIEKPSTKANFVNLFLWANSAQEIISNITLPSLLYACNKKNVRSLSKEEFKDIEKIKFNILFSLKPFEEITAEKIYEAFNYVPDVSVNDIVNMFQQQFISKNNRKPKIEELRQIYSSTYALLYEED